MDLPARPWAMDLNPYALELIVQDKLARLRAEAARHALATRRESPTRRLRLRARVGLALMRLGRWVRGADPGARGALTRASWHARRARRHRPPPRGAGPCPDHRD